MTKNTLQKIISQVIRPLEQAFIHEIYSSCKSKNSIIVSQAALAAKIGISVSTVKRVLPIIRKSRFLLVRGRFNAESVFTIPEDIISRKNQVIFSFKSAKVLQRRKTSRLCKNELLITNNFDKEIMCKKSFVFKPVFTEKVAIDVYSEGIVGSVKQAPPIPFAFMIKNYNNTIDVNGFDTSFHNRTTIDVSRFDTYRDYNLDYLESIDNGNKTLDPALGAVALLPVASIESCFLVALKKVIGAKLQEIF